MKEKIPYQPIEEKRFAVSHDPFSRERLQLLKDLKTELEQRLGFRAYLSLFGSLSKGKQLTAESAPAADIDLTIFLDGADLREKHEKALKNDFLYARFFRDAAGRVDYGSTETRRETAQVAAVESYARSYIAQQHEGGTHQLGFSKDYQEENIPQITTRPIWPDSIMRRVEEASALAERTGDELFFATELSRFFHLNVGGGLEPYIRSFLADASALPKEQRDEYWHMIKSSVEFTERKNVIPEEMRGRFPQTFEDAVGYFK